MPISTEVRKAGPFAGNNVTTSFPFAFKVFLTSNVQVVVANNLGVESVLVEAANYAVSLNANQNANPGGSVNLFFPLATGSTLVIISRLPNTQLTDLTNQGGFYPQVITDALDKQTILTQQIDEKVSRALLLPVTLPETELDSLSSALLSVNAQMADVTTVANNIDDISDVGQNITSVIQVSDNMSSVINAASFVDALNLLALRKNLCDNPYFGQYTRTLLPATFDPLTFSAGVFIRDRWKAGAGGFTRSGSAGQNIGTQINISSGTVVHQIYQTFVPGDTITIAWSGTAMARVNSGAYAPSPIVYTFGLVTDSPSIEWSGNGTFFTAVRIHRGVTDLGVEPFEWSLPVRDRAHYAQFYQRVRYDRQFNAVAGQVDRATVTFVPMVVSPTASIVETTQNVNVSSFTAEVMSNNALRCSITATGSGATRRESLIALDTGF